MDFALSTNWNSSRHPSDGAALVDEALALGFDALELGYKIAPEQVAGILDRVRAGTLRVCSVHAFCPAPISAPAGAPELHLLANTDEDDRRMAVLTLQNTLRFAADVGARAVVAHAGRVPIPPRLGDRLARLHEAEQTDGWWCRHTWRAMQRRRARRIAAHLEALHRSLDEALPAFAAAGIRLGLENLPSWDALPHEEESLDLMARYAGSPLACWQDIGHAMVRQNLGFCDALASARALLPHTVGIHIHDVRPPDRDHLVAGTGQVDFDALSFYAHADVVRVFEPAPGTPAEGVVQGLAHVRRSWAAVTVPVAEAVPAAPAKE